MRFRILAHRFGDLRDVALAGPGSYALDALVGFALPAALAWGLLVLAALAVIVGIAMSRRGARSRPPRKQHCQNDKKLDIGVFSNVELL